MHSASLTVSLAAILALGASCHWVAPHSAGDPAPDVSRDSRRDARLDAPPPDADDPLDLPTDALDLSDLAGDAPVDGQIVPDCMEGTVWCGGECKQGDDCTSCNETLFCLPLRRCVSKCTSCPSRPIECFACDKDQNPPEIGTCEAEGAAYCLGADYGLSFYGAQGTHCDCSDNDVIHCLSDQHVCNPAGSTDWCVTCGEAGQNTHGKDCKGGGKCDTSLTPPRCI